MLYLTLASLIWAFSFGIIKNNLTGLDPSLVSFLRMLISLLVFLPLLKMHCIKTLGLRTTLRLLFVGAIQFGLMYVCYIYSFRYLSSYEVALFTIFTPLYVVIIDTLLNKRNFERITLFAVTVSLFGAAYISYNKLSDSFYLFGILLVQASNISFALGQLYYKKVMNKNPEMNDKDVFALLYLGGTICTLILVWANNSFNGVVLNKTQILTILYLGVVASGIAFFLWNVGAVRARTSSLAIMNNAKIPLAVAASLLFFNEQTRLDKLLIGGGLMLVAIAISELKKTT